MYYKSNQKKKKKRNQSFAIFQCVKIVYTTHLSMLVSISFY